MAPSSLRSDRYLRQLFREYNRRYWGGKLPNHVCLQWASKKRLLRECGRNSKRVPWGLTFWVGETPMVLLYDLMKKRRWWSLIKGTLHHELVHVDTKCRDGHAKAFDRRMLELARKNAFHNIW